jgi:hypothetical protein
MAQCWEVNGLVMLLLLVLLLVIMVVGAVLLLCGCAAAAGSHRIPARGKPSSPSKVTGVSVYAVLPSLGS